MSGLFLIVRMAGETVALSAAEVEAVVEIDSIVPVPGTAPHILGLAALRSRVVTVVDCAASLEGESGPGGTCRDAVVAVIDGHPYALLVDSVEDVIEIEGSDPLPAEAVAGWRRAARFMVETEGKLLLVVDVAALVAGPAAPPHKAQAA